MNYAFFCFLFLTRARKTLSREKHVRMFLRRFYEEFKHIVTKAIHLRTFVERNRDFVPYNVIGYAYDFDDKTCFFLSVESNALKL